MGDRGEGTDLEEGVLRWSKPADIIEVARGDECGHNQKEMEMVELEVTVIPFVPLFATSGWRRIH
jgi:hypothetical protein